jgi:starch synthase
MYGWEVNKECVGIPADCTKTLEIDGKLNMVKGAIETSTRVSTVSPSYAGEILDPWFSHGLDKVLKERSYKLCGILNGIDNDSYNPATDFQMYANYTPEYPQGKEECKRRLQERLNLPQRGDIPMIAMVSRLVSHKGLDLVRGAIEDILNNNDVQLVVLGSGDKEYEDYFWSLNNRYPGKVCFCPGFVPELARKIYAGSDIFLMPSKSEPCGLSQMIALRYGSIPVVREVGGLRDSIHDSQDGYGNGFTFKNYGSQDMHHALTRAINGYWNRDGWRTLVYRAMTSDNSWGRSANDYINVYRDTIDNWR